MTYWNQFRLADHPWWLLSVPEDCGWGNALTGSDTHGQVKRSGQPFRSHQVGWSKHPCQPCWIGLFPHLPKATVLACSIEILFCFGGHWDGDGTPSKSGHRKEREREREFVVCAIFTTALPGRLHAEVSEVVLWRLGLVLQYENLEPIMQTLDLAGMGRFWTWSNLVWLCATWSPSRARIRCVGVAKSGPGVQRGRSTHGSHIRDMHVAFWMWERAGAFGGKGNLILSLCAILNPIHLERVAQIAYGKIG